MVLSIKKIVLNMPLTNEKNIHIKKNLWLFNPNDLGARWA